MHGYLKYWLHWKKSFSLVHSTNIVLIRLTTSGNHIDSYSIHHRTYNMCILPLKNWFYHLSVHFSWGLVITRISIELNHQRYDYSDWKIFFQSRPCYFQCWNAHVKTCASLLEFSEQYLRVLKLSVMLHVM